MLNRKLLGLLIAALIPMVFSGVMTSPVSAQNNLLVDGSFEFTSAWPVALTGDGATFSVPPGWGAWAATQPRIETWMNLMPFGFPQDSPQLVRAGRRSQQVGRGYATFTAAVHQTVTVPANSNVTASAWAIMEIEPSANPNAQARIGIDPAGGRDPLASGIVWSNTIVNAVGYTQMTVNATASGTQVTLFLYATQTYPGNPNGVYWDDAILAVGGAGGTSPAAPAATANPAAPAAPPPPAAPPALAPFVSRQGAQADGSLVHTVQTGDTLWTIAVAYRVTPDDIRRLNPDIGQGSFLFPGQRLLIFEPGTIAPTPVPVPTAVALNPPAAPPANNNQGAVVAPPANNNNQGAPVAPPAQPNNPPAQPNNPPAQPAGGSQGLCITVFEDVNNNRIQDSGEGFIAGALATVESSGVVIREVTLNEPQCLGDLAAGDYVVRLDAPAGYGVATLNPLRLRLRSGERLDARFGVIAGASPILTPPAPVALRDEAVDNGFSWEQAIAEAGPIIFVLSGMTLIGGLGIAAALNPPAR